MIDHSENTLRAAIKCLRDTVAPAVDPRDPQAIEQLRLTVDFLEFLRSRIYDIHGRHRYELARQIEVAAAVAADAGRVSARAVQEIDDGLVEARRVYASPDAQTADLRAASRRLLGAVRGVVRTAREASVEVQERIAAAVVTHADPLVEMASAWYLPFGFEPRPQDVPELGQLLRDRTDRTANEGRGDGNPRRS